MYSQASAREYKVNLLLQNTNKTTLTSSHEETSKKFADVGLKFTDEIVSFGGDSSTNSFVA